MTATPVEVQSLHDVTRTIRAACPHDCPDTCQVLVTVEEGKVTGVRGDPEHPFTRGVLCAKVNDFETRVYDPTRLLHPMRRTGPKGSGEFERIGWDEAISEICSRFSAIVAEYGGEAIMPSSYLGNMGTINGLNVMDPFMHRLGATIGERSYCTSTRDQAYFRTVGPAVTDPEGIVHARYILIWGHNMMSSHLHLWPFVLEARRRGAKIVVIDPSRSRTANSADWHIPIRPGTDVALALGMMKVIVDEGLTDEDYIARHTNGFAQLAAKVKEFPAERVAEITGVPAEDVRVLAREYAGTQPSMIRLGTGVESHSQGGQALRAIYCLPALVGAWRHPGGGAHELTLFAFPVKWDHLSQVQMIRPGTRVLNIAQLGRMLTGELEFDGPPIKALMICNHNPVITMPEQAKTIQGLSREDLFTVVSDIYLTDTARFADIVLPATTFLEHFDIMFSWGHLYVTLNNQAIEPLGEAISNTELFRRLAKGMGFDDPWFSLTDEELVEQSLDWAAPQLAGITLESLKQTGYARLNVPGPDEAPFAEGGFPTPSTKVELTLPDGSTDHVLPVFRQGYDGGQENGKPVPSVPDYFEEATNPAYPLRLAAPRGHAYIGSQYANRERQRRIERGRQHVVLNPTEAAARGLGEGQRVSVFNERGAFEADLWLDAGVALGTAVAPYGFWMENGGATLNVVVSADLNDLGGGLPNNEAAVEVRALTGSRPG
jgi:anaerobic selenocysteine-containing dehydrogenase